MCIKLSSLLKNKNGNITITWLGALPVFIGFFLLLGSMGLAWASKSTAQTAADAGSFAATKKIDELLLPEIDKWIKDNLPNDPKLQEAFPDHINLNEIPMEKKLEHMFHGNHLIMSHFVKGVIKAHEGEIANAVRTYVQKNGGKPHGRIVLPVNDRVEVEAEAPFESLLLKEYFAGKTVKEKGAGPKRIYLKGISEGDIVIEY
ncbi:Tad domain-containing protein [Lihuaxuella thermophila]|uniref:Putative Flp pilus-assembly TadE/G-like n=1 Tax=Lihuaxuella thermophila TaxID=1173111 RepID=A0A1H8I3H5_9BACL|nr:Tad domain-containing protein [Lihuaxuella thermophila]SEN63029.1 Putative Flp pilus-assembly TadE/G-like [Lihuaxuella thermophila]